MPLSWRGQNSGDELNNMVEMLIDYGFVPKCCPIKDLENKTKMSLYYRCTLFGIDWSKVEFRKKVDAVNSRWKIDFCTVGVGSILLAWIGVFFGVVVKDIALIILPWQLTVVALMFASLSWVGVRIWIDERRHAQSLFLGLRNACVEVLENKSQVFREYHEKNKLNQMVLIKRGGNILSL
jgi:hypothetical protein